METATKTDVREILVKLANLQREVKKLKEHLADITLSSDDLSAMEEAEKEFREGKTISLENLKKELRI